MSNNNNISILTIGHSDHRIERFLVLLARSRVDAVADVRSVPQSRFNPQYNRDDLAQSLQAAGIYYVFLGDELGARRREPECYLDGKARYELIACTPSFKCGLERLQAGAAKMRIALLCAEKDPLVCHRSILVCRHLRQIGLSISHIHYDGRVESHETFEQRLLKAVQIDRKDLLTSEREAIEAAYDLQGDRIAFTRNHSVPDRRE